MKACAAPTSRKSQGGVTDEPARQTPDSGQAAPSEELTYVPMATAGWKEAVRLWGWIIEMSRNAPGDTGRMVAPLVALSLFFAAALGGLSFGLWTANQVVLRVVYGSEEVDRWGLKITAIKPDLRVSNGDTLEEWSFRHWAISAVVWLPSTVGLFLGLRRLMPADYRRLADLRRPTAELPELPTYVSVGCVLALLVLILAFITLGLGRGSVLLAATALSVAWVAFWRGGRSAE